MADGDSAIEIVYDYPCCIQTVDRSAGRDIFTVVLLESLSLCSSTECGAEDEVGWER